MSDTFELSSGLIEDYTGTITDAYFGFDAAYNNGGTCLLKLVVSADDKTLFDGGETTQIYTVGEGFEPTNGGAQVAHESGKQKNFNKQSGVGLLIQSVADIDGGLDILRERGTAFDAGIWKGLHVEFYAKEFSAKINGEDRTWTRTLIRSIGDGPTAEVVDNASALDPVLRGKLKAIAVSAADHDAFIEKAFSELDLSPEAEALVVDASVYADLRAS
jgi:hypothetical protein